MDSVLSLVLEWVNEGSVLRSDRVEVFATSKVSFVLSNFDLSFLYMRPVLGA